MKKTEEKQALCEKNHNLLYLLHKYGKDAMPLPQLRALALMLGLYTSGQAANRAVRALKSAGVLTRRTWVDGKSDLILACKYVPRYFAGVSSQGAATPPRAATLAPYLIQSRKVDWLMDTIVHHRLETLDNVEHFLFRNGCTLFLGLGDLADFYLRHRPFMASSAYESELRHLAAHAEQRRAMAPAVKSLGPPVVTLETLHRKGIYIANLSHTDRRVIFALFPRRGTQASRILDYAETAAWWTRGLLPGYEVCVMAHCLDRDHADALRETLNRPVDQWTCYWEETMRRRGAPLLEYLGVDNSGFIWEWCGGICHADM